MATQSRGLGSTLRMGGLSLVSPFGYVMIAAMVLVGCGGNDESTPVGPLMLSCSTDIQIDEDEIGIGCSFDSPAMIEVQILIGGPSSSTDIYGIKFDLVFDSTIVNFASPALEGPFLGKNGGSTILQADVAEGEPGRLVVALSLQGAVSGVQATSPQELVVTVFFIGMERGSTLLELENGEVVDSNLTPIGSVVFVGPATITVT